MRPLRAATKFFAMQRHVYVNFSPNSRPDSCVEYSPMRFGGRQNADLYRGCDRVDHTKLHRWAGAYLGVFLFQARSKSGS
jgi:hypothetical protein